MTRPTLAIASSLIIVALLLGGALAVSQLPHGVCVPFPWDRACEPSQLVDRYGGILYIPGITAAITLALLFLPDWDRKDNSGRRWVGLGWSAILIAAAIAQVAQVAAATGAASA
jgi:hypothetical protein